MNPATAVTFLFLAFGVNVVVSEVNYKSNCFSENADDSCDSKTIRIGGKLYGCDEVVYLKNRIQSISFKENNEKGQDINVVSGEISYTFNTEFKVIKEVKTTYNDEIKRCNYIIDITGNAFKIEDSTVYAIQKNGIERVIEIPDNETGHKRVVLDLALDTKSNQLIISTTQELFSFNLNLLKKNVKLAAKLITPGSLNITGYGIFEGLDSLILGLDENGKFKVVKISVLAKSHSCAGNS